MLKPKSELEQYLEKRCEPLAFDDERCKIVREYLYERYDIPMGTTMDMIVRDKIKTSSEYELFCLLDGIDFLHKQNEKEKYYSPIEIKHYSDATYVEEDVIKFPLVIDCLQVKDDQWIGISDSNFLMRLRKAQKINYDVNAQRVMKRIIRGGMEYFKIAINKNAVSEIRESMTQGSYIPNTITLNIGLDSEAEFYYDKKNKQLVINSIKAFDMSDGYHRYIAMSQEHDRNPDFCQPIELRIINFANSKVKQFIFQEDQKTKMRKIDSESMNMNKMSNLVLERLNEDAAFNLKGQINRNEGLIPFSEFSTVVDALYFADVKKSEEQKVRMETIKALKDGFNALTEMDETFYTMRYTFKDLLIITYLIKRGVEYNEVPRMYNKLKDRDLAIKGTRITKTTIKSMDKLMEEV